MKIFIAYRFTGEDPDQLRILIHDIFSSLEKAGHKPFCTFWHGDFYKNNKFTKRQILEHGLNELDNSDVYLAFIKSEEKSEGMLLEAGYAIAKGKKFYLAIKKGINTVFLHEMADKLIEFETFDELRQELSHLK